MFGLSASLVCWTGLLVWEAASHPAMPDLAAWWPPLVSISYYAAATFVAGALSHGATRSPSRRPARVALLAVFTTLGGLMLGTVANVATFSFKELQGMAFPQNVLLLVLVFASVVCAMLDARLARKA